MSVPGGWLDQRHVDAVGRALRAERGRYVLLRTSVERRLPEMEAAAAGPEPEAWVQQHLDSARTLLAGYVAHIDALTEAQAVLQGIEYGARVEALPSPEEETEHERQSRAAEPLAHYRITAEGRERLAEILGHEPTDEEMSLVLEALG